MSSKKLALAVGILIIVVILCLYRGLLARYSQQFFIRENRVQKLTDFQCQIGGQEVEITLPAVLKDLPPGSKVVLFSEIQALPGESLLFKPVFSPARVYFDDIVAYSYGLEGSYPVFMNDPPTSLAMITLPENGGAVRLQIEYSSPTQRSEISLPAIYIGREGAVLEKLFLDYGASFLFSLILIFLGIVMVLVSLVFVWDIPGRASFLWLGLFSLSAGAWVFGECDLSVFFFDNPPLLYLLDYLGLFFSAIPLLHFGLAVLKPQNKAPLRFMLYIHYVSVAGAVLLQLWGAVDLMKSLYWFHLISPLGFLILAADLLWEYFRHQNAAAKLFAPAGMLLALSVLLEVGNYWLGMTNAFTVLFQIGLLAYIVWLGVVSGRYVRQSLYTAMEKEQLEYEVAAMGRQILLQREQYGRLMQSTDAIKAMRHDMRHHMAVVERFVKLGKMEEIRAYIENWENHLEEAWERVYCENHAVNAIIAHYLGIAEKEGVQVEARLKIPEDTGVVLAMDLCVLVGNLLENALEACRRMEQGTRFIHIRSRIDGDTLSVVVDNSFDGRWQKRRGVYLSRKTMGEGASHQGGGSLREGVGLSSVKAVCEKYRGMVQYETDGNVWKASALVHMQGYK